MFNLVAGLLFTGIFCLNGGAFGYVPSNGTCRVSEVVFIDPSVQKAEEIVSQLPKGSEVVRLSPGVDGVGQISAHLAKKRDLSAIHIISHGNAGHFVLNGKRIDGDFLRDHGRGISGWGRSLTENGDILLYACHLADSFEGKLFVKNFAHLTNADIAASTDITGGKAFRGNWDLEYSIGQIDRTAITVGPNIGIKLQTWNVNSGYWNVASNWDPAVVPTSGDAVVIPAEKSCTVAANSSCKSLELVGSSTTLIVSSGTLSVTNTSDINGTLEISAGTFDANGDFDATGGAVNFTGAGYLNLTSTGTNVLGTFTKGTGTVTYDGTGDQTVVYVSGGYNGIAFGGTGTKTATGLTATTLSAPAEGYSIVLDGQGTSITNPCTFSNTGALTLKSDPGYDLLFLGGVTATAPSAVTFNGAIRTSGDAISIGDADTGVSLGGDSTLDTTYSSNPAGAAITLGGTVDGDTDNTRDLTLNAGTGGTISVAGAVGGGTSLKHLTVTNSNGTTFTGDVTTGTQLTLSDTTTGADITFSGTLATGTLSTMAAGYNVKLHGGCTITNNTEFYNTGTVALGDNSDDTLTFNGGIETTGNTTNPSSTTLNGAISTSNNPVALGTTTVAKGSGTGITTIDPAGGALTFGATTINSGATLKAGAAGNAGTISFNSTVDGPGDLEINTSGSATLSQNIGTSPSLGVLTLTNGNLAAGDKSITAGTITVDGGIFGLATSPSGVWDVDNVSIASGAEMNATTGAFKVSGDWTNSGTFDHKSGTVTLDGASQTLSGSTTFNNLIKTVASASTLTFPSATRTTVVNALTLKGTGGALLSLISSTSGTQWEIDPQGTRTIEYLDVMDSNNVDTTPIDAGTHSVSSGNNTNWTFPTITSFSPTSGGTGTSVTITGSNFSGATAVTFGGTNASSYNVDSTTQITAVIDSGTTGKVAVTTSGGTANSSADFTFIDAPTIASFSPTSGGTGTSVTITGTNFSGATAVTFGGTNASSYNVDSTTQITAVVDSGTTGKVVVTTPGGTANSSADFTFIDAPTIASFSPTSGGTGASVTITGTNFSGATAVTFGGTNASSYNVDSTTQITAVVDSGTTGKVVVTTPGGTANSSADFTFIDAPTIASFSPTSGGTGTSVTITGTNFSGATAVTFGGTNASSYNVDSTTQITAVVNSGTTGKVVVTTPGGTATSAADFTFIATPTITSFSPTSGGTSTSVTITGTNFTGTTAVKFGGTDASSFNVYSFTQIEAIVAGGSTGTITVTTPGGTATSDDSFTYSAVTARTYYVNIASGNDSNAGTEAAPWKTLHHAINQINGGATGTSALPYTLNVALGTYSTTNGEADTGLTITQNYVTVEGASGSGPIIDGSGATSWAYGIKISGSNVTLRNLYVTGFIGTSPEGTGIEIISGSNNTVENCRVYENHDGISVSDSSNCTIQGCQVDNNNFDGISISGSADSVITRNSIYDNFETDNSDGIIVEACSPEISRNTIYDNRFNISLQGSSTTPTSPTIKNNLIYESTLDEVHYGIYVGGITGSTVHPQIYHNTIDGSLYQGILIEGTGDTPIIKYNIVTNCRQSGIQNSGTPTIDYNDVWHNGPDPYDRNYDGCTAGANDISQDPQYASYTLAVTSPCINAIPTGNPPDDPVTVDFDGDARPYGVGFDMGAYEMDNLPAVSTTAASSITATSASSGGDVTSDGGASVTARGVCWSTSTDPTTADSKTTDGTAKPPNGVFHQQHHRIKPQHHLLRKGLRHQRRQRNRVWR